MSVVMNKDGRNIVLNQHLVFFALTNGWNLNRMYDQILCHALKDRD